jgi:hypothetical protein
VFCLEGILQTDLAPTHAKNVQGRFEKAASAKAVAFGKTADGTGRRPGPASDVERWFS